MLDLTVLDNTTRLLFTIPLRPVQGDRFQPTGFPSLGAAEYQTRDGRKLLVESAQSMANRLESTCWDAAENKPVEALGRISHVTVNRKGAFLTDSMLEAHRLNSPYIERSAGEFFSTTLPAAIGVDKSQPIDRSKFVGALLKYDVGCLLHGVFLEALDGRLRIARALSAFIEASNVQIVASGGVKNDRVQATKEEGKTSREGFGNVPFSRDEYVAERIDCHINFDLAQIRGYGLPKETEELLVILALYRLRKLLDGDLRLRTACDLEPIDREKVIASRPSNFKLPTLPELEDAAKTAIMACSGMMIHTKVAFEDELKKAKETETDNHDGTGEGDDDTDESLDE